MHVLFGSDRDLSSVFHDTEECDFHLPSGIRRHTSHIRLTIKDKSPENSALKSDHVCITDPTYRLRLTLRHMRQSIATNTHTHTPPHTHTNTHTQPRELTTYTYDVHTCSLDGQLTRFEDTALVKRPVSICVSASIIAHSNKHPCASKNVQGKHL